VGGGILGATGGWLAARSRRATVPTSPENQHSRRLHRSPASAPSASDAGR
jgi:hypothetical protein